MLSLITWLRQCPQGFFNVTNVLFVINKKFMGRYIEAMKIFSSDFFPLVLTSIDDFFSFTFPSTFIRWLSVTKKSVPHAFIHLPICIRKFVFVSLYLFVLLILFCSAGHMPLLSLFVA